MTLFACPPSAEMRKCADPLASGCPHGHHVAMTNLVVQIDRSLRMAVSDEAGKSLAALRLTRSSAEGLADALLEFSGNRVRGCSKRTSIRVGVRSDAVPPQHPANIE